MLTAYAQVQTARARRYLVQLCRHAAVMGAASGHRRHSHAGGDALAHHQVQVHAEYSDTGGTVTVAPGGRCTLQASPDALMLCIEATDEDNLRRVQEVITGTLERFGRRDRLTVAWQPPAAPAAPPGAIDPAQELHPVSAAQAAPAGRGRRTRVVFATAGALGVALAVAVHAGLGAAVTAASRWVSWTAVGLVIVPVVVVLGHAAAVSLLGVRLLTTRRKVNATSARDDR
jgi:hypothetical protein